MTLKLKRVHFAKHGKVTKKEEKKFEAGTAYHKSIAAMFKANQARQFMGPIDLSIKPEDWSDMQGLVWYAFYMELSRRHENKRVLFSTVCGWR